jgi:hypothetical protein
VAKNSVRVRGWDYPHVDQNGTPLFGRDWSGQEIEWEHHLEIWRLYQSGQFYHILGMFQDWRDQSSFWPAEENWEWGTFLGLEDTVFRFTEIFEFAARLSLTDAGDDFMHIEIKLVGLDRRKISGAHKRLLFGIGPALSPEFTRPFNHSRLDLIARPKELALDAVSQLFNHFGWNPSKAILREIQSELGNLSTIARP